MIYEVDLELPVKGGSYDQETENKMDSCLEKYGFKKKYSSEIAGDQNIIYTANYIDKDMQDVSSEIQKKFPKLEVEYDFSPLNSDNTYDSVETISITA